MNHNLTGYVNTNYPEVAEEFERYLRRDTLPAIGTKVKTLVAGYGGIGGQILYVIAHNETYIELGVRKSNTEGQYLCNIKRWYIDLKILDEPKDMIDFSKAEGGNLSKSN